MRGFDHATIRSPSFHGLRKEAWHNDLPFVTPKTTKNSWRILPEHCEGVWGTLAETLTLFQTKFCDFRYPILDLIKNQMMKK